MAKSEKEEFLSHVYFLSYQGIEISNPLIVSDNLYELLEKDAVDARDWNIKPHQLSVAVCGYRVISHSKYEEQREQRKLEDTIRKVVKQVLKEEANG